MASLPKWWEDDFYRKDVLLFTERLDKNEMKKIINSLELKDERLHFGQLGVYWVKYDKSTYSQTAYHKKLLKTPFYPDITIRNARTFSKIGHFLRMQINLGRNNMSLLEKIRVTQAFLESKGIEKPEFGLILGSGLGELAEEVEDAVVIAMRIFQTGDNQRLLVMLVNLYMVHCLDVRFWLYKDVSISMKEIR